MGKGRTIAGLILENWQQGRHKHLWLSVGSDLKIDTQRDLNDVGGRGAAAGQPHPLLLPPPPRHLNLASAQPLHRALLRLSRHAEV